METIAQIIALRIFRQSALLHESQSRTVSAGVRDFHLFEGPLNHAPVVHAKRSFTSRLLVEKPNREGDFDERPRPHHGRADRFAVRA